MNHLKSPISEQPTNQTLDDITFTISQNFQIPIQNLGQDFSKIVQEARRNGILDDTKESISRSFESLKLINDYNKAILGYSQIGRSILQHENIRMVEFIRERTKAIRNREKVHFTILLNDLMMISDPVMLSELFEKLTYFMIRNWETGDTPRLEIRLEERLSHIYLSIKRTDLILKKEDTLKEIQSFQPYITQKGEGRRYIESRLAFAMRMANRLGGTIIPVASKNEPLQFTIALPVQPD